MDQGKTAVERINQRVSEAKEARGSSSITSPPGKSKEEIKNSFLEIAKERVMQRKREAEGKTGGPFFSGTAAPPPAPAPAAQPPAQPREPALPAHEAGSNWFQGDKEELYAVFGKVDIGLKGTAPRKFLAKKIDEIAEGDTGLLRLSNMVKEQKETIMSQASYYAVVDQWFSGPAPAQPDPLDAAFEAQYRSQAASSDAKQHDILFDAPARAVSSPDPVLPSAVVPKAQPKPAPGPTAPEPMSPPESNVDKFTFRARKKFDQMDVNGNGLLDGTELLGLSDWVWASFHPAGKPLEESEKTDLAGKLLSRLDKNSDGHMDFDEFIEWFRKTCASIEQYRRGLAQRTKRSPSNDVAPSSPPLEAQATSADAPGLRASAVPQKPDPFGIHRASERLRESQASKAEPSPEPMSPPESNVDKFVFRARKKFDQLDVNGNGLLDGTELLGLSDWVWASFHPAGKPLEESEKTDLAGKLLSRLDKNSDGHMDFDEFIEWFRKTCASIEQYRRGLAQRTKRSSPKAEPSPEPMSPPESNVDKFVFRARKKFDQLDTNENGLLDGTELLGLSDWVWTSFHPAGKPLEESEKTDLAGKLLSRLDKNSDGHMDFDEFIEWFRKTCASIEQYRRGLAYRAKKEKQPKVEVPAHKGHASVEPVWSGTSAPSPSSPVPEIGVPLADPEEFKPSPTDPQPPPLANPQSRLVQDLEAMAAKLIPQVPRHFHKKIVQWSFQAPGKPALVQAISSHDAQYRRVAAQFRHALYLMSDVYTVQHAEAKLCEVALNALQSGCVDETVVPASSKVRWQDRSSRATRRRERVPAPHEAVHPGGMSRNLVLRRIFLRHARSTASK